MKYHICIEAPNGSLPCGPFEDENFPKIGSRLTVTVEEKEIELEVLRYEALPIVPEGTFKHDETWVHCKPV